MVEINEYKRTALRERGYKADCLRLSLGSGTAITCRSRVRVCIFSHRRSLNELMARARDARIYLLKFFFFFFSNVIVKNRRLFFFFTVSLTMRYRVLRPQKKILLRHDFYELRLKHIFTRSTTVEYNLHLLTQWLH